MIQRRTSLRPFTSLVGALSAGALLLASAPDDRVFAPLPDAEAPITRIAFGSCFDPTRPGGEVWGAIDAKEPDLFLFVGDNVYADTADADEYRAAFEDLEGVRPYVGFREQTPVVAVWDDHDFGLNDSGSEFPAREQSQRLFLDAFGVPDDSPRRSRPGIYDAMTFGAEGERLQVIVLDTRYFRSTVVRDRSLSRSDWVDGRPGYYQPDTSPGSTILGEDQWAWLEERLREPADARLIVTSYQFVADEHRFEKWGNFPAERARMIGLIEATGAEGVFFVSGDRHRAELSRLDEAPYPLYDLTSSALNRSGGTYWNELNEHRVGSLFSENNFGLVEFAWGDEPAVTFKLCDAEGTVRLRHRVRLDALSAD